MWFTRIAPLKHPHLLTTRCSWQRLQVHACLIHDKFRWSLFKVSRMNALTRAICPKTSTEALSCFKIPVSSRAFTLTIHLYPQIHLAGTNVIFFNPPATVDEIRVEMGVWQPLSRSVSLSVHKPTIILRMITATSPRRQLADVSVASEVQASAISLSCAELKLYALAAPKGSIWQWLGERLWCCCCCWFGC